METITLAVLPGAFTIHRLAPDAPIPDEVTRSTTWWIGRTAEELSIVCDGGIAVPGARSEPGWSAFRVAGTIDFAVTGVMARISGALAGAGIGLFALSTFDTDYVLVRTGQWPAALACLREAGFVVRDRDDGGGRVK